RQGNASDALPLVNQVRARAGVAALSSVDADAILLERGFELAWEAVRRMDLIRYGKFNDAWTNKDASPAYTKLFPIPASALGANPNLEQNPGY
ncbi:MAG TPA: RagB/SusD family nutrient uptake outer membrane protein, partial [Cryomorphaceae bacterium]|nr:RagB/SusD family nutrient uptake outer membrane protein [Cryomorphaceae bacterium]